MSGSEKISPNDTCVLDEDFIDEMDEIGLTGLLDEISEQLGDDDAPVAASADEDSTPDTASVDDGGLVLEVEDEHQSQG